MKHVHLVRLLGEKPVHHHRLGLSDTVSSSLGLQQEMRKTRKKVHTHRANRRTATRKTEKKKIVQRKIKVKFLYSRYSPEIVRTVTTNSGRLNGLNPPQCYWCCSICTCSATVLQHHYYTRPHPPSSPRWTLLRRCIYPWAQVDRTDRSNSSKFLGIFFGCAFFQETLHEKNEFFAVALFYSNRVQYPVRNFCPCNTRALSARASRNGQHPERG